MDIKKYISSGILEQYVLGFTSEEERREVEQYANAYPEIKKELDAIEVAMEQYATAHELPKPAGVETKFNQQIDELIKANPTPPPSNNTSSDSSKKGGTWLPILLAIGLLSASWLAFSNFNNNKNTQSELTRVQSNLTTLQTNCDETNQENQQLKNRLDILLHPDNQVIKLASDDALASIIYNKTTQKTYFNIDQLAAPPTGRDYQLWAIVDGQPTDMGIFNFDDDLSEVPFFDNASAFAVTLETGGGNPTPNLDALVFIGET